MRLLNITAFFFALTCALLLYGLNYETRKLEAHVVERERELAQMRDDIAVLKAERSHLSRPQRIDPLARQLGLKPPRPDQFEGSTTVSAVSPATGQARQQP